MSRLGAAIAASMLVVGCRQVAGINPITYAGAEGGTGCSNGTVVISTSDQLDLLSVTGGYAFAAVVGPSGFGDANLVACPTGSTCTQPKSLLTGLAFNDTIGGYAAGSKLFYTVVSGSTGSLHSAAYDGTGDQVLLGNLTSPAWVAVSGTRTFWVTDDLAGGPAEVHCYGCGSGDMTWMTGITATGGLFADANNVYVLADDGTAQAATGVYGCSVQTACGSTLRSVIKGFTPTSISPITQFAADGTNVYVTNDSTQIIRIDPTGTQKTIATNVAAVAIAVDPVTGELFYGDDDGTVGRLKTDGSTAPSPMGTCDPQSPNEIYGIAFDSTYVYVLLVTTNLTSSVYAIKR